MNQNIEQIDYRFGLLGPGMKPDNLPVITWCGSEIPAEVLKSIDKEGILSLGGIYGLKDAGDPVEYDHLRLVLTGNVVEIEIFNRGITLYLSDDERVMRIHRVLCALYHVKK